MAASFKRNLECFGKKWADFDNVSVNCGCFGSTESIAHNNNNGRNGSFLRGWLPHRGKAQMACNYCFPTRTMF